MAENVYDLWSGNNGLRNDTKPIMFTNARILDATGESTYTGEVEISGNRIKSINKQGVGSYNWNSNGTQNLASMIAFVLTSRLQTGIQINVCNPRIR